MIAWTEEDYLRQAYKNAIAMSDDPSTQNGAVLVSRNQNNVIYGANRMPRGIKIPKEEIASWAKDKKYRWMVHAEQSVLDLAGFRGVSTFGATLYCPWYACTKCARSIIDCGVVACVGHRQMRDKLHPTWMDEIEEADAMLDMRGVKRIYVDADLFQGDSTFSVLFRDELWIP